MKMKTGICALDPCFYFFFYFFWSLVLLFFLGYDFMGLRFCIYYIHLRIRLKMALVTYRITWKGLDTIENSVRYIGHTVDIDISGHQ